MQSAILTANDYLTRTAGQRPRVDPRALTWQQWERDLCVYYAAPNFKPPTRKLHVAAARKLSRFADRPADIDALALSSLVSWLGDAGKAAATINSTLRSLRAQVRILLHAGVLDRDPFAVVRLKVRENPADYRRTRHLSLVEIERIFRQADIEANHAAGLAPWGSRIWRARRRRALLYLVACTGIRRGEALGLRIAAIHFPAEGVAIIEITGETKTVASRQPVPLTEPGRSVIRAWIQELADRTPWLFPQSRDPQAPWRSGSSRYRPTEELKQLGRRAGVDGLTPLALRHSWATHAETAWGMTAEQIQRILRHTNLTTQKHYRHADLANIGVIAGQIHFRVVGDDGAPPGKEGV